MPYIPLENRRRLRPAIEATMEALGADPTTGELNYLIGTILDNVCPSTYSGFNDIIGVLECVKQEFYRKAVATYEDRKCKAYGEVYRQR